MSGFDALAAFEPLARLVKREGTLDGSVPLRVAQACVPMLEGNAFGHQLAFRKRLVVRSRLGRRGFEPTALFADVDRAHRAAVPLLVAHGHLRRGGPWHTQLEKSWWWTERGVLRIWTGLLVRPRNGTWLRVAGAGSRAILGVSVRPSFIADDPHESFVPLVLDLDAVPDGARLEGEVANIAAVVPDVRASLGTLDDAPDLAEAHAAFYDAAYFAAKKGEVTRKYRRTIAITRKKDAAVATSGTTVRIALLAGPQPALLHIDRALGPDATKPVTAPRGASLDVVRFLNAVPFEAHYDGNTLAIDPDQKALAAGARTIERVLASAVGASFASEHQGSVLYLTKYFTPHPNGEPHFFVKPWAFTTTDAGWSSLLDGVRGTHWDVMRGVVWTDRFHATPAVFSLVPGQRIKVGLGAPLLDLVAFPRRLDDDGFTMHAEQGR